MVKNKFEIPTARLKFSDNTTQEIKQDMTNLLFYLFVEHLIQ